MFNYTVGSVIRIKYFHERVIWGSRREAAENRALLGYYAVSSGN